jgi:hypothetical protein
MSNTNAVDKCCICLRSIDKNAIKAIGAIKLGNDKMMHPVCMCIRNQTIKTVTEDSSDIFQEEFSKYKTDEVSVHFANCEHGWQNLSDVLITTNEQRCFFCILCAKTSETVDSIVYKWSGRDYKETEYPARFIVSKLRKDSQQTVHDKMVLSDAINQKLNPKQIAEKYASNNLTTSNLPVTSVSKHLCMDYYQKDKTLNKNMQALDILNKYNQSLYSISEMIHMGMTLEMAVGPNPNNWEFLLAKRISPVEVLMQKGIQCTITRMIFMGVTLDSIIKASYTIDELILLHFCAALFLAVNGTVVQLEEMLQQQTVMSSDGKSEEAPLITCWKNQNTPLVHKLTKMGFTEEIIRHIYNKK